MIYCVVSSGLLALCAGCVCACVVLFCDCVIDCDVLRGIVWFSFFVECVVSVCVWVYVLVWFV